MARKYPLDYTSYRVTASGGVDIVTKVEVRRPGEAGGNARKGLNRVEITVRATGRPGSSE